MKQGDNEMRDTLIETEERESGLVIEYHYDINASNPRDDGNIGTLVVFHRAYNFGDVDGANYYEPFSVIEEIAGFSLEEAELASDSAGKEFDAKQARRDIWAKANANAVILGVEMLEHSGIRLRTCGVEDGRTGWDSGQVGYIYTTKAVASENGYDIDDADDRNDVNDILKLEIDIMDDYVSGNVYGFIILEDGNPIDGYGGIYNYDYAKRRANEVAIYYESGYLDRWKYSE